METVRPCGCKGIRSCLICEAEYDIKKIDLKAELEKCCSYVYCPQCDRAWPGWDIELYKNHPNHHGDAIEFPGVYIKLQFLNPEEASTLAEKLDDLPWETSQSGRRKQNFGPKCNFKKKKLRLGSFVGFPNSTRFVQEKLSSVPLLNGFQTVEQCSLEYDPERGASIDPHIDDCWIWGERIVTVNISGDSVLTMTPYSGSDTRYNLKSVAEYSGIMYESLKSDEKHDIEGFEKNVIVRLPMPEKSLIVLYGPARYKWEHCVLREDVKSRRICLAYREFTPPYLNGTSESSEASEILRTASNFW